MYTGQLTQLIAQSIYNYLFVYSTCSVDNAISMNDLHVLSPKILLFNQVLCDD